MSLRRISSARIAPVFSNVRQFSSVTVKQSMGPANFNSTNQSVSAQVGQFRAASCNASSRCVAESGNFASGNSDNNTFVSIGHSMYPAGFQIPVVNRRNVICSVSTTNTDMVGAGILSDLPTAHKDFSVRSSGVNGHDGFCSVPFSI